MAMAAQAAASGVAGDLLPSLPKWEPRPRGYGVHLSKGERRGKSFGDIQRMREERRYDADK